MTQGKISLRRHERRCDRFITIIASCDFPNVRPKLSKYSQFFSFFFRRRFKGIEMPQSGLFSATTPESPPTLFSAQSGLCSLSRNNRGREEERGNLDAIKRSGGRRKESTVFARFCKKPRVSFWSKKRLGKFVPWEKI